VQDAGPIAGVLLTHLHADHILGLRDLPSTTPIYVGPGDTDERSFMNMLMRGVFDHALSEKAPLRVLQFKAEPRGALDGVLDVFGDGSLWAIWAPGHTPGSVAYLARTSRGPVLFTGDVSHTSWGWKHGVEPGTFSDDRAQSAASFAKLQRFAARHPGLDVRLGHQALSAAK
jgi:N-acyl homoserine lactone hydrolase